MRKRKKNPLSLPEAKRKLRDEQFKYKMGHRGFRQFTFEEIKSVAIFKWRRRVKKTFK